MAHARHRKQDRSMPVSAWLAAGATTVGVGAALLTGAAAANAKPASNSSDSSSSHRSNPSHAKPSRPDRPQRAAKAAAAAASAGSDTADKPSRPARTTRNVKRNNHPAADAGQRAASAAAITPAAAPTKADNAAKVLPKPVLTRHDTTPKATADTGATAPDATPFRRYRGTPTTVANGSAAMVSAAAVDTPSSSISGGSTTTETAPTRTAGASGVLSTLAAMGQALTVSVRNSEHALTKAARSAAPTTGLILPTAAAPAATSAANSTAADTLPTGLTTPVVAVDTVDQAIDAVRRAQTTYMAATAWNPIALLFNGLTGYFLQSAVTNLITYKTNQQTLMDAYAADPSAANLAKLQANEALPDSAINFLGAANFWTWIPTIKSESAQASLDARVYGSVPLTMYLGTEPIITISVNGGPPMRVLIDTGSSGLVIPEAYAGNVNTLGNVVGSGSSGFGTGVGGANVTYDFNQYDTTVDFGYGLKTGTVTVNVVTAETEAGYMNYIGQNGVVGVLGIGTNAVGPGGSIVSTKLPGMLNQGVFIDEKNHKLWFGPNPLPVIKSIPGSPNIGGYISLNGGSPTAVNMLLDSGGVFGTMPEAIAGNATATDPWGGTVLKKGTVVTVYAADGTTVLFSYTVPDTSHSPTITATTNPLALNTGYQPFALGPMYINYVDGTTVINDANGNPVTYYGQTEFDY